MMSRVSIGLGVYNGEKFLRQTLDSIVAQTFRDFELIISDNASSDGTEQICREYAAHDTRIRYTRNPVNIGFSRNFNQVFQLSSGRYFRWASADDVFAPTSLKECVDVLDMHPEVALCYPKTVLIDGDGSTLRSYNDNLDLRFPQAADRFRLVLQNLGLANVQYGLIRADVLARTPLFGAYPGADMVLIAELALYGQFWEIPQELFFRRMHDGASSALRDEPRNSTQEFWNAAPPRNLDLYCWTHRRHNLGSIFRAPISALEKFHLACFIGGYVFRSRNVHLSEIVQAGGQLLKRLKFNPNS